MAGYKNPDFTQINLADAPQVDEATWKAEFEKRRRQITTALLNAQWSMSPLNRFIRTTNTRK